MASLHLLPHTEAIDGIQRAAFDLCRGLARAGEAPSLLALRGGNNLAAWEGIATVEGIAPFLACSPRQPGEAVRTLRLAGSLRRRPDIVVAHRLDLVDGAALIGARTRAPVVLHAHNAPPPWLRWGDLLRAPGTRRLRRVIVASRFMADAWRQVAPRSVSIEVVEYPIDLAHFRSPSERERSSARQAIGAEREFVIGFVGRLERAKGLHVAIGAARRMHERGDRVRIVVQGGPGLGVSPAAAEAYRQECLGALGDCPATWLPAAPDVRGTLYASDVCVVPSVWPEPSGLTVAEAMAAGTPVIASAVGGIPEQLPTSPLTRLVPPDDAVALATALAEVRARRPSAEERRALRNHVESARLISLVTERYQAALVP